METLSTQLAHLSENSLDRYRLVCDSPAAIDNTQLYAVFQLAGFNQEDELSLDYEIKVSVWNSVSTRLSRDVQISPDQSRSCVAFFELPDINNDSQTYCFVDLVHRDTGVSMGSGSVILNSEPIECSSAFTNTSSRNEYSGSNKNRLNSRSSGLLCQPFAMRNIEIELHLSDNLKHWKVPKEYNYIQSTNSAASAGLIILQASVGFYLSSGKIIDRSHLVTVLEGEEFAQRVLLVPQFKPTLYDCLSAEALSSCCGSFVSRGAGNDIVRVDSAVWHATVDDLQLTSDILDLYAERNIIITGACGGSASLAQHSYLGNIHNYQGNYTEKAELAVISSSEQMPGSVDVYHTCLNFEVKVMECSNTSYTGLDGCILCTGVLHHANKVSELDGTPPNDTTSTAEENDHSGILSPSLLTSGVYEVLLYTVYNPESEIDTTLVGKVCVTLHVPQLEVPLPVSHLKHWSEYFDSVKFTSEPDCRLAFTHFWMRFHACSQELNELQLRGGQTGWTSPRPRVDTLLEMSSLLRIFILPEFAERAMHAQLLAVLCRYRNKNVHDTTKDIVKALHAYFQDWLASDSLYKLMTIEEPEASPLSSPTRPLSPSGSTGILNRSNSSTPVGSPMKGRGSPGRMTRKALLNSPPVKVMHGAFDQVSDLPWEPLEAACACVRVLRDLQEIVFDNSAYNNVQCDIDGDNELEQGGMSDFNNQHCLQEGEDFLDVNALHEITEDLAGSIFLQLSRVLQIWRAWYSDFKSTIVSKGRSKLAQNCVERIKRGVHVLCVLFARSDVRLKEDSESELTTFVAGLCEFCTILADASSLEDVVDAGSEEEWRSWMSEHLSSVLGRVVTLVVSQTYPANILTAVLPHSVEILVNALQKLRSVRLLTATPQWNLVRTLSESISLMRRRITIKLASFPVSECDGELAAALGLSLTLWNTPVQDDKPVAPKVIVPPPGGRKVSRRASALNMFGADVTMDATASSTAFIPNQNSGVLNRTNNSLYDLNSQGGLDHGGTNTAGFDPLERNLNLLSADEYCDEAVLYFLHENRVYLSALQSLIEGLLDFQHELSVYSRKNLNATSVEISQRTVGVIGAMADMVDLISDLVNAILRGKVLSPELLKGMVRSASESNGTLGKGMLIFLELFTWTEDNFFTFLSFNEDLLHHVDNNLLRALSHRIESTIAFHFHFFDVLLDSAHMDKHLNRAAWLGYRSEEIILAAKMGGIATTDAKIGETSAAICSLQPNKVTSPSRKGSIINALSPSSLASPAANLAADTSCSEAATAAGNAAAAMMLSSNVRNKRYEDFTVAGAEAVSRWLTIREELRLTIHTMCTCMVKIADAVDRKSLFSIQDPAPLPPCFQEAFSHSVTLLCRCMLMTDVAAVGTVASTLGGSNSGGGAAVDIIRAITMHMPLHRSIETLFRLAESMPVSLQVAPTSGSGTFLSVPSEEPLTELISVIMELVNLDLILRQANAVIPTESTAIRSLAQLLEHRLIMNIHRSKDDALFNIKILLRCLISDYLLVNEDPALSAQPIIKFRKSGEIEVKPVRTLPVSEFPRLIMNALLLAVRQEKIEATLHVSLVHFRKEFEIHLMSLKMLLCARYTLTSGDHLLQNAASQHLLLRSMFEKTIRSASVGNMITYALQYMNVGGGAYAAVTDCAQSIPKTCEHIISMVDLLAHTFSPKPEHHNSNNGGMNSSELLSVFGCSFKAYHDVLRLLVHHHRNSHLPVDAASSNPLVASEASKRLEEEIRELRHCLQWILRSGQWEVGIEIASAYLEKFKASSLAARRQEAIAAASVAVVSGATNGVNGTLTSPKLLSTPSKAVISVSSSAKGSVPPSPMTTSGQLSPMRSAFSPTGSTSHQHFSFDSPDKFSSPTPSSPIRAANTLGVGHTTTMSHAKRHDTMKHELMRVLDTLQSRINSDGPLRLFSHYYAVLFVSDQPWEKHTRDEVLLSALADIRTDEMQSFSASWLHAKKRLYTQSQKSNLQPDRYSYPGSPEESWLEDEDGGNGEDDVEKDDVDALSDGLYEYWMILKFDCTSYPTCADFYDDIRLGEGPHSASGDLSLQSPISYHNIQAQLSMAYPGFSMVTSHHQLENYFGENHTAQQQRYGYNHGKGQFDRPTRAIGSVNYMQLFQAFPAAICDDALSPDVLDSLQEILDAATATTTVTAEDLLNCSDPDIHIDEVEDRGNLGTDKGLEEQKSIDRHSEMPANEADGADNYNVNDCDLQPKAKPEAMLLEQLQKYPFAAASPTKFYAYTLLSEDQLTVMNDMARDKDEMAESSAYIYRYELSISEASVDFSFLGGAPKRSEFSETQQSTAMKKEPTVTGRSRSAKSSSLAVLAGSGSAGSDEEGKALIVKPSHIAPIGKVMNAFCVSPVNFAVHRSSSRCTPIQASVEMLFYHAVLLQRALAALQQLNEFSKKELEKEPVGDIISSDSIFVGVFTLLSNLLTMPNASCCSFSNMETILISEQERIDLEWQAERRDAKRSYMKALEEYEEDKEREAKKWKKLMKVKPEEPDLDALKAAFDAQPGHARLRALKTLHDQSQLLVWRTIKELRKFVMNKDEETQAEENVVSTDQLRSMAMRQGRRPTVTSMVLRTSISRHLSRLPDADQREGGSGDSEKSLKMKLCLYLESLFAAMEVGIPI